MKRLLSGVMASLVLFGVLISSSGCNSDEKKEAEIIKETDPWYSCTNINIASSCNALNYDNFRFELPVVIDDLIFVNYTSRNGSVYADSNYHEPICIFDTKGNLLKEFELTDEIPVSNELGLAKEKDKTVLYYSSNGKLCKADFNKSDLSLENLREIDIGEKSVQFATCTASGDYTFAVGTIHDQVYIFVIKDDTLVLKKQMNMDYAVISEVTPKDNGYQLRVYNFLYFFDPVKLDIKADGVASFDDYGYINSEVVGYDGRTYVKEVDGIYVDGEPYLRYCDTDCNVYSFMIGDLLAVEEDSVALSRPIYDYGYGAEAPSVMILSKEDTNPNAGKTVITARSYGNCIDTMTGEAIRKYNKENSDYYVKYASVSVDDILEEEFTEEIEKKLKEEIASSEAADIYFGVDTLWWFQTEDYFVDLSQVIDLDPDTYYTKITDAISKDGKMFYMPLCFYADGLMMDSSSVKEGAKGFTYDEYKEFVSTVGNGTDAISDFIDRNDYFYLCFSTRNDIWFKDGKVNIANEEFEELCDYFINNVQEKPKYAQEDIMAGAYNGNDIITNPEYGYETIIPSMFSMVLGQYKDPVLLGFPSSDRKGAFAIVSNSVSVSAGSDLKEGCYDFIRMLISKDIQELSAENPINRTALPAVLDKYAEIFQYEYKEAGFTTEAEAAKYNYYLPTDEMKASYIKIMENIEIVAESDQSIMAIVNEELSAAYAGQKDIKEIEASLQDRLSTLYSEKYSK